MAGLVTTLVDSVDPTGVLNGPWRSIESVRVRPDTAYTLTSEALESVLFVKSGRLVVDVSDRQVTLGERDALTLVKGADATFRAQGGPAELFVVRCAC